MRHIYIYICVLYMNAAILEEDNKLLAHALQHIATRCNALPRNTLQHTATPYLTYTVYITGGCLGGRRQILCACTATCCSTQLRYAAAVCCSMLQWVAVGYSAWHMSQRRYLCNTSVYFCCSLLQHTAAHCSTLHHTASHCSTLQHTAAHYSTLQRTATHCNTLQHTDT